MLNVPLTLPVLRPDGTEIICSFLVQRAPGTTGRAIYLASIEPIDQPGG